MTAPLRAGAAKGSPCTMGAPLRMEMDVRSGGSMVELLIRVMWFPRAGLWTSVARWLCPVGA